MSELHYKRILVLKRIIISSVAALLAACIAAACCSLTAKPSQNASACIFFSPAASDEVYTEALNSSRISALRSFITSVNVLEQVSGLADVKIFELSEALSITSLEHTHAVQITVAGLDRPENAPIILGALINLAQKSESVPDFQVITYCDITYSAALPTARISISAALLGGLAAYLISKRLHFGRKIYYSPRRAEKDIEKFSDAPHSQRYIESALNTIRSLGPVDYSAPEGLSRSGYTKAADELIAANPNRAVIAIAPAYEDYGKISIETRFIAYLSCAAAQMGKRAAVIECNLKNPQLHMMFGKTGKGGISDIAAGSCTIWDALIPDAREGVDIITETHSYPAPAAVFSSASYSQLISYLSSQYDLILLRAPKAWGSSEWELIARCCTGIVAVMENDRTPDKACASGIMSCKEKFTAFCKVIKPEEETGRTNKSKG